LYEKFKDITWVFRSLKSKDRQNNEQNKKNNDLQNITQKLKIEQLESYNTGVNSGAAEGLVVPSPLVVIKDFFPSE
jgi:hypothetical protein